jgi:drug/metabolite transporter (DMT)-like permease
MKTVKSVGKESGYGWMLILVITTWGIVPGLAQLGNLDGDVTTFYVNWIAVLAIAAIITLQRGWVKFKNYTKKDYLKMIGLGLIWPFIYSVAYFQSIKLGDAAFTTVLNYTWPIFFMAISAVLLGRKSVYLEKKGFKFVFPVLLAVASVGVYVVGTKSVNAVYSFTILFGLTAAFTQALFCYLTGNTKYDDWVLTFVIEVVTAVLVTPMVLARSSLVIPNLKVIGYLALIGAVSNGIGFWAFVKGSRLSTVVANSRGRSSDPLWLIGTSTVPISQIVLLPLMRIPINTSMVISLVLIGLSLALYKTFNS